MKINQLLSNKLDCVFPRKVHIFMHFENKFMVLLKYAEKATTIFHFWGAASVNFVPTVKNIDFSNFSCMFLNPNNFFQF